MEKLLGPLGRISEIEQRIYANQGELSATDEDLLIAAQTDLEASVESVAWAYKNRKAELEYAKKTYKHFLTTRKEQLERFKHVLLQAAQRAPKPLASPLARISVVKKTVSKVIIIDFDQVVEECPEAVSIYVDDNVKKITLSKEVLKKHFAVKQGGVNGYEVIQFTSEYPDVRFKGWQSDFTALNDA